VTVREYGRDGESEVVGSGCEGNEGGNLGVRVGRRVHRGAFAFASVLDLLFSLIWMAESYVFM
jgi:hypothetical protein